MYQALPLIFRVGGVYIHVCVYMGGTVTAKRIISIIIVYVPFSDHCVTMDFGLLWEPVLVAQWSERWQLVQA